ncbi:stage II sporulation protein M [Porticoccus sp. W117]|uniref:stage II sporulation protein M n=1 Tax=Porticoccus sp. W117 TaxID=3054777 RepID=UPI00259567E3|nr:stage II sporulation protein M [Porticoccus sp. W117]MDM3871365.1 stage II sporulation protein M [Porticoccus sp. W117]
MKQQAFEQLYKERWEQFDRLLDDLDQRRPQLPLEQRQQLPALYRRLCAHYALAQQRHYSPHLVAVLHQRVMRGHQHLYRSKSSGLWRLLEFLWVTFPNQLRRHHRHFWLATALFYLPAIFFGIACYQDGDMIYSLMPDGSVARMEYMYDPANEQVGRDSERKADSDIMMLGHYIWNNVSIDFRSFALGILAAIGTVLITLFNGFSIGGVAGHLSQLGFTETFWPFVSGHGPFELTALTIATAAGLRLGQPLLSPGPYRRIDALKIAAGESIQLLIGAAVMTTAAAFIEAFWSPNPNIPIPVKYGFSALMWVITILYLWRAGRGRSTPRAARAN